MAVFITFPSRTSQSSRMSLTLLICGMCRSGILERYDRARSGGENSAASAQSFRPKVLRNQFGIGVCPHCWRRASW